MIGRNLLKQNKPADAEPLLREAGAIFDKQQNPDAASALAMKGLLGSSYSGGCRCRNISSARIASASGRFIRKTATIARPIDVRPTT